jgi:hypothetical protein
MDDHTIAPEAFVRARAYLAEIMALPVQEQIPAILEKRSSLKGDERYAFKYLTYQMCYGAKR